MQADLNEDDDMALEDTPEDPVLDEAFDAEDAGDEDTTDEEDGERAVTPASAAPHRDMIHSGARRAIEALRESRRLQAELRDEWDD